MLGESPLIASYRPSLQIPGSGFQSVYCRKPIVNQWPVAKKKKKKKSWPSRIKHWTDIHLLLNKLQTTINRHDSFVLVLLQQNRPDELVDVGFLVQRGEFTLDAFVLLLLRLELLAGVDEAFKGCGFEKSSYVSATVVHGGGDEGHIGAVAATHIPVCNFWNSPVRAWSCFCASAIVSNWWLCAGYKCVGWGEREEVEDRGSEETDGWRGQHRQNRRRTVNISGCIRSSIFNPYYCHCSTATFSLFTTTFALLYLLNRLFKCYSLSCLASSSAFHLIPPSIFLQQRQSGHVSLASRPLPLSLPPPLE